MVDRKEITADKFLLPENMIRLYAQGAFPMADEDGNLNWYCPEQRTIIPLDNFNIPRSLKSFMKNCKFEFKFDNNIGGVIKKCAARKRTWISPELIDAYSGLINRGHVHSVEVYLGKKLVGGLYGVTFRGAFFGESMFSKVAQASKTALVKLLHHLKERGFVLLDIQFITPHLKMFGAQEISFDEYFNLLLEAYGVSAEF